MVTEIAFGYVSTIRVGGFGGWATSEEGSVVRITPKVEIEGWDVKSGNVTVTDNQFTMPGADVEIEGIINSDAISGGLIGRGYNTKISNSIICPTIEGRGCIGGIAGMASTCEVNNSIISATFKPTEIRATGNLVDQYVGYLDSRENGRVAALTKEVNDYVEEKQMTKGAIENVPLAWRIF